MILALGAISALWGVLFALLQRDLKRLLAYSSVENIGLILMALGLALVGRRLHLARGAGGAGGGAASTRSTTRCSRACSSWARAPWTRRRTRATWSGSAG